MTSTGSPRVGPKAATVGGLLQSVTIGRRLIQIQVEYSPKPDPRIVAVAAWEGKILLRKSYPLDHPLDEHEKDRLLAIRSREFTNLFRETLVQRARDRIASTTPADRAGEEAGAGTRTPAAAAPQALREDTAPAGALAAGMPLPEVPVEAERIDGAAQTPGAQLPLEEEDPLSLFVELDFEPPELVLPTTESAAEPGPTAVQGVGFVEEEPATPAAPLKVPAVVQEAVREIATLHGVLASAFVTRDGADSALVAVQGQPTPNESCTRLWGQVRSKLDILGKRWRLGELISYLGEGEEGFYVIFPAGSLGCFLILVSGEQNPALMKKSIERIIRGG
ncbi:MAG: hypothetical protein AB1714_26320 [Acidobacteriota bacterium]